VTAVDVDSLAIAAVVGILSGTHAAIWGMYKDAVHEGFVRRRFARSVVVGSAAAVAVQAAFGLAVPGADALVVLFGLAYAAERGAMEVWKTFLRNEDQGKYFIPMQFSVRGIPVASRSARLAAGAAYVAVVTLCLVAVGAIDDGRPSRVLPGRVALAALVMGAVVAIGGAWKDSPKEGFQTLKFFRSPGLTVAFALLLSALTTSYLLATTAAIGYERAAAETYKTFFLRGKAPGKFAGKPVLYPEMLARRRLFVPLYVAICAAVLASGVVALREASVAGSATAQTPRAEVAQP
jgi:hypothetical protein